MSAKWREQWIEAAVQKGSETETWSNLLKRARCECPCSSGSIADSERSGLREESHGSIFDAHLPQKHLERDRCRAASSTTKNRSLEADRLEERSR